MVEAVVEEREPAPLYRQYDFVKLWVGQGLSEVGSQVTEVALPLTAVITLHATAGQVGLLNMARWLPFLLFTLIVGVYADRVRRLALLVGADIGRAVILIGIVTLAATGFLTIPVLIGMVFVFGAFRVLFEVSYNAYVPSLVERESLVTANSSLQATASVAQVGGPALGGLLVQLVTAPMALLADGISFVVSVGGLLLIRIREPRPAPANPAEGNIARIKHGLRVVYRNRILRALVGVAASYNFFDSWILTLFMLYAVHDLGLHAGSIGLALSGGAVGAVVGAVLTGPLSRRIGLGGALLGSVVVESVVLLAVPLTPMHHLFTLPLIAVAFSLNGMGTTMSSVAAISVRQSVTPIEMLGRMTASYRFVSYGVVSLGAAIGGLAGELAGVRSGLLIGTIGMVSTIGWVVFSPLPKLHTIQDAEQYVSPSTPPAG